MLVPKRVKHRREFRGKMRGEAKGGKEVSFGVYDKHFDNQQFVERVLPF